MRLASTVLMAGILCSSFFSVAAQAQTPQATPDPVSKPPVVRRIPQRNPFVPPPPPAVKATPTPVAIGSPPPPITPERDPPPRSPRAASTPPPTFSVIGIVASGNSKTALLSVGKDAEAVHEGAVVNGYRVISIRPDQRAVQVTRNNTVFRVRMAESGVRQKSALRVQSP